MSSSALAYLASSVAAGLLLCSLVVRDATAGCEGLPAPALSYAATSNRIYVNAGCATMADLLKYRLDGNGKQKGPIWHFDMNTKWYSTIYTGTYYLESNVHIRNGATLSIDGSSSEVDGCTTLLLASNSSTFLNLRAHGGNMDIRYTKIFSWDISAGGYDTNVGDGRSYLNAITEKITGRPKDTCYGGPGAAKTDMGVANMDILNSELAYLGYDHSESYGIAYKARGLCNDLSNLDIYDDDNGLDYGVTGDIYGSNIHHNWFGHYSWGHDGGKWQNNVVHDNYGYGFDPHDDSDNLVISGNTVYNNGWHGIIASKRCTDIIIENNVVYNNGDNGIMLHRSCDRATVRDNHSYNNADAGLALYESSNCQVYDNTFESNRFGVRWSNGANSNTVYRNTIKINSDAKYALYMYKGNDEVQAEGNIDGRPKYNKVYGNEVYSDKNEAWKMVEADSNEFSLNTFHNGKHATFKDSEDNEVYDNSFPTDWYFKADSASCFRSETDPVC